MPEALAVLAVFVVAIAAWLAAWLQARNPANSRPGDELARLRVHALWLEQRLDVAQRERWSGDMIAVLADEFHSTKQRLAVVAGEAQPR